MSDSSTVRAYATPVKTPPTLRPTRQHPDLNKTPSSSAISKYRAKGKLLKRSCAENDSIELAVQESRFQIPEYNPNGRGQAGVREGSKTPTSESRPGSKIPTPTTTPTTPPTTPPTTTKDLQAVAASLQIEIALPESG